MTDSPTLSYTSTSEIATLSSWPETRLKTYPFAGMAQGYEHDPKYSLSNYARFSGQFFVMVL